MVRAGLRSAAKGRSSKPITERSPGTSRSAVLRGGEDSGGHQVVEGDQGREVGCSARSFLRGLVAALAGEVGLDGAQAVAEAFEALTDGQQRVGA